jgi:hypothetical protein
MSSRLTFIFLLPIGAETPDGVEGSRLKLGPFPDAEIRLHFADPFELTFIEIIEGSKMLSTVRALVNSGI